MLAGQAGPSIYVPAGNLNASSDAFGRIRQSTPYTLFDNSNTHLGHGESDVNHFVESTSGSGASSDAADEAAVLMTVSGASGDEVIRQSRRYMSYQPGKSLLVLNTVVFASNATGLRQRVGYFNQNNGVFLEQDDSTVNMVQRSYTSGSVVERRIAQANWNVDKLDGSGPSGVVLDLSKSHIFWMDIEWLGVGSVRTGFVINGQFVACHVFHNANIRDEVYMSTAELPCRYEITNTGNVGSASTMKQICSSVISEGGYEPRAITRMAGSSVTNPSSTGNTGAWQNVATIRIGTSGDIIVPAGIELMNLNNADLEWGLFLNATPATAFNFSGSEGRADYTIQATTLTSTGIRVAGGFIASKTAPASLGTLNWDYQLGESVSGVSETLTLAVRGGNNNSIAGIIKWFEP